MNKSTKRFFWFYTILVIIWVDFWWLFTKIETSSITLGKKTSKLKRNFLWVGKQP